jgi:hypothetical protein
MTGFMIAWIALWLIAAWILILADPRGADRN